MDLLSELAILAEDSPPPLSIDRLLSLCRTHDLTSYDATYLELAIRRNLPLATLDSDLRKAAISLGIAVLGM